MTENDKIFPYRTMPNNTEAEKTLLGAILVNNRAYHEKVSGFLRPEHFAFAPHGRIFQASAQLIERGQIADPVTLRHYFETDESLAEIGGPAYIAELMASAVPVTVAKEYARLIYDLSLRRELIVLGEEIVNDAYEDYDDEVGKTAEDRIKEAIKALRRLGRFAAND